MSYKINLGSPRPCIPVLNLLSQRLDFLVLALYFTVLFLTLELPCWALDQSSSSMENQNSNQLLSESWERWVLDSQETKELHIVRYLNKNREVEVKVRIVESHLFTRPTELTVLTGRDLDENQKVDTWFFSKELLIQSLEDEVDGENELQKIKVILKENSLTSERSLIEVLGIEILSRLLMTAEQEMTNRIQLEEKWIDLIDLDLRINRLSQNPQSETYILLNSLRTAAQRGWTDFIETLTYGLQRDRNKALFTDASLFVGGGVVLKSIGWFFTKGVSSLKLQSVLQMLSTNLSKGSSWFEKIKNKSVLHRDFLPPNRKKFLNIDLENASAKSMRLVSNFKSPSEAISKVVRNNFLVKTLKSLGLFTKDVIKSAWEQKNYVLLSQGLQLAIESYNRGYWKFANSPLILKHPVESTHEFLTQITEDQDLQQNLTYMTLQTTLGAGANQTLINRKASLKFNYAICSAITLIDSAAVNVFIQGKTDIPRISFDTSWELLIGGTQIKFDNLLIRKTQALADHLHRPGLALVGYLLVIADQGLGYFGYNVATHGLFEENPPVQLIPVMAPPP